MNFSELLKIEFLKTKRSHITLLLFIAPLLVVSSGVASLRSYLSPEYPNAWAAMFIQSALIYSYYLLPLSMIVVCVMIAGRETDHNGILKMLALPISRYALSAAKFCVLLAYLLLEMVVFMACFVIAGWMATFSMGIQESLPLVFLLKWCGALFLTMIPSLTIMWAITVVFDKLFLSIGINILLVIPGILMANTPLRLLYPYCYSGYLVSLSLHSDRILTIGTGFTLWPFVPIAVLITAIMWFIALTQFGKKEMS